MAANAGHVIAAAAAEGGATARQDTVDGPAAILDAGASFVIAAHALRRTVTERKAADIRTRTRDLHATDGVRAASADVVRQSRDDAFDDRPIAAPVGHERHTRHRDEDAVRAAVAGLFELSGGCSAAASCSLPLPSVAAVLGWTGLAVHFQILSVIKGKLSSKRYFLVSLIRAVSIFFVLLFVSIPLSDI